MEGVSIGNAVPHHDSGAKSLVFKSAGDIMGEGDTTLVLDLLDPDTLSSAFEDLKNEVKWNVMKHHGGEVPRLVAVQGEVRDNGSFPIYRHPSDESPPLLPFSPTVSRIRSRVEEVVGHPVNHVLIQLYRSGNDYISEHSDKTIDVDRSSKIVNVSLGAQRTMILRLKKVNYSVPGPREAQRINLPHNSMFILGLETNAKWLHSIRQDNRMDSLKSPEELAFNNARISLTFRKINTFLTARQDKIYGQGATAKTVEGAGDVINGDRSEADKMIRAFSAENRENDFQWDEHYGQGFDVLHFTISSHPATGTELMG